MSINSQDYQQLLEELSQDERDFLLGSLEKLRALSKQSSYEEAWYWLLEPSELRLNPAINPANAEPDPQQIPIANRDVLLRAKKIYDRHLQISPEAADIAIEELLVEHGL